MSATPQEIAVMVSSLRAYLHSMSESIERAIDANEEEQELIPLHDPAYTLFADAIGWLRDAEGNFESADIAIGRYEMLLRRRQEEEEEVTSPPTNPDYMYD
jgi:hypothetical protein